MANEKKDFQNTEPHPFDVSHWGGHPHPGDSSTSNRVRLMPITTRSEWKAPSENKKKGDNHGEE